MPTIPQLTELTRYDGRYFVDVVLPALRVAGFDAPVAVVLTAPSLEVGNVDEAAIVVETTGPGLDALCAGKLKLDGSPTDAATRSTSTPALVVRGGAGALRQLLRAARPLSVMKKGVVREVGAEASALALRRKRDRVRTADGRYIKGTVAGGAQRRVPSPMPAAFVAPPHTGGGDRLSFALQNVARFLDVGLARAADAPDDVMLALRPGEVERG